MQAGKLDKRVTFRHRQVINPRERGPFQDYLAVWAQYVRLSGREQLQAGREVDFETGVLRIRNSSQARTITSADRVMVMGKERRITSVGDPDRRGGFIEIGITTDMGET